MRATNRQFGSQTINFEPMKKGIFALLSLFCTQQAYSHSPTWVDDIACIVISHCSGCHNSNGIAPFSLTTYDEVYANRNSIANSVRLKRMPPFSPTNSEMYAHTNTLTEHEIEDIEEWVLNLAPFGDISKTPPVPSFSGKGQIENPDLILKIPNFLVNTTSDLYKWFIIPTGVSTPKFIQSIEVIPSNYNITHHALVYQSKDSNINISQAGMITGYVPGQREFRFPDGFGNFLAANSYIAIQVHYPGGVNNIVDSSSIRIKWSPGLPRNIATVPALEHNSTLTNGPLIIPANTIKTFYNKFTVGGDVTIFGLSPHMHLLGKSIKASVILPAGDTMMLVNVPKWDFSWQGYYNFKQPIKIPAGSTLIGEATYDNTSANFHNPNKPPKLVTLGEGTGDEMFLVYFNFTGYQAGDENLIIDADTHSAHYNNCNGVVTHTQYIQENIASIYPNPGNGRLTVSLKNTAYSNFALEVYNPMGQVVHSSKQNQLDLSSQATGMYIIRVRNGYSVQYLRYFKE